MNENYIDDGKCFFDKKKCSNLKNIIIHLAMEDESSKIQYCCTDCLYKIKKSNVIDDKDNLIGDKINKKCPSCKSNILEICQNRAGCPLCYEYFKNDFEEILEAYHSSKTHIGKRPKENKGSILGLNIISDLEKLLNKSKKKDKSTIEELIKEIKNKLV